MRSFTSKRDLKKHIDAMSDEVAQSIIPAAVHANVFTIPKAEEALTKLADLRNAADSQLSVKFGKKAKDFANPHEYRLARNAFFKQVYAEAHETFHKGVAEILNEIQ